MSDKAISLVSAEWEALCGLPYLQVRLYLVLRWYMDVATGRTGEVRGISLQSLAEELYVEPAPGRSESGSPTKKAVRNALVQLEKHGLIEPCGNGEVLVFCLPKAACGKVREKLKGHKRGTVSGHGSGHLERLPYQGFPADMGHANGHTQNPIKGHTSEVIVNPIHTEAAAAVHLQGGAPVDKSALLVLPLQPDLVAEWLRLSERERGCRARVDAAAPQIVAWIGLDVTPAELSSAYAQAKADRSADENRAPINLPFLDIFVRRVVGRRGVSRGEVRDFPAVRPWWVSHEGIVERAKSLGVELREGEESAVLRSRVEYAEMLAEDAQRAKRKAQAKAVAHG